MMSRLLTAAAAIGTLSLISTPAAANCGSSIYCSSGMSQASHGTHSGAYDYGTTYGSSYGSGYGYTSEYGGVVSDAYADSVYGSGSVSESYTLGNYPAQTYSYGNSNVVSFPVQASSTGYASASNWTVPGLGMNERLSPTDCPTAVHNPEGGRVLGCYSVVRPAPAPVIQQRVQVVRPVIYVPYAVPTPVYSNCVQTVVTHSSRYGGSRYGHGQGHHGHHGARRGGCR